MAGIFLMVYKLEILTSKIRNENSDKFKNG
jgi:hypothetical protein